MESHSAGWATRNIAQIAPEGEKKDPTFPVPDTFDNDEPRPPRTGRRRKPPKQGRAGPRELRPRDG